MLGWFNKLLNNYLSHAALLEKLENQAKSTKEQLNQSLFLAHNSTAPVTKVLNLEVAKSKFVELQSIAAEHPRMRLKNEKEVDLSIKALEKQFSQLGYYVLAQEAVKQNASVHVKLSQKAKDLL